MNRLNKILLGGAIVALALLIASPAQAACGSSRPFGNYPSDGTCGFYCYMVSPGTNTIDSIKGYYWVLGDGALRNSGTYEFDGTGGSQTWGVLFTTGWSLSTDTENGGTAGCPSPDPTVWVFSDTGPGGEAYWAISAADYTPQGVKAYDLGLHGGNINLVPLPALTIDASARGTGGELIIDLSWAPDAAAAFTTSSATITDVGQVVSGWTILKSEGGAGRQIQDWTEVGGVAGADSNLAQVTFTCDNVLGQVNLALAPELDGGPVAGGATTAYVGAPSTTIECNPNVADPQGNRKFKLIEKPKKKDR